MLIPNNCPGVPQEILNPKATWKDKNEYNKVANELAKKFIENFKKFAADVNEETSAAAPKI